LERPALCIHPSFPERLASARPRVLKFVWPFTQHVDDTLRGEKPAAVAKLEASLQAQMSREVVSAVNDERRRTDVSSNTPHILKNRALFPRANYQLCVLSWARVEGVRSTVDG
jgi:hypothetical protein